MRRLLPLLFLVAQACDCGPSSSRTTAQLELDPLTVDFGQVLVGSSRELPVRLINTGRSTIVVSSATIGGADVSAFRASGFPPITITAGTSTELRVTFSPSVRGPAAARLVIDSNAANAPQLLVPVVGEGVAVGFDAGAALDGGSGDPGAGVDAGLELDGGAGDAGAPDGGVDAGVDAGLLDAGFDAGLVDAGVDAGILDAGPVDAGAPVPDAGCPADMATVNGGGCVDRYEASQGAGGQAVSAMGVMPWLSLNTMQAATACGLAGKRLCTEAEWQAACAGPTARLYPYGNTYGATTCNGLDRGLNAIATTGMLGGCVGGYPGVYDMSGNAYERTATCSGAGCRIRGGSFRSSASAGLLRCNTGFDFPEGGGDPAVGFRCCR